MIVGYLRIRTGLEVVQTGSFTAFYGGGSIRRKILHFFDKYFVFLAVLPYLYGADLNERQISQP